VNAKRKRLLMAGPLAAGILLGTAGLAIAQDPTSSLPPGGMMGGLPGVRMMAGLPGVGMMGNLSADQLQKMRDLHDEMLASGRCDPADMAELHQDRSSR